MLFQDTQISTCIILTRRQTDHDNNMGLGPRIEGLSLWYIKYVYIRWRDQAMVCTAPDSISSSPWLVTEVWSMQ